MYIPKEPGGHHLNITGARGTVPHLNPGVVNGGQSKEHNAVIAALQQSDGGQYHWLMDNYQWRDSRTSPPGYNWTSSQWPAVGSQIMYWGPNVSGTGGDIQPTIRYIRSGFRFDSTVQCQGNGTKCVGSTTSNWSHFFDGGANQFTITSANNTSGQHQYDSTTRIYDLTIGDGTSVSATQGYATTCGDGASGPYTHQTSYNCYHSVTMIYVR
jgi:hypothetical protein